MSALEQLAPPSARSAKKSATAKTRAGSGKRKTAHKPQKPVSLEMPDLGGLEAADRKEVLTLSGKAIASSLGSRLLLKILAESGKSMRELARETGFDVSVLSNIATGKRKSGPELWTLVALADAMGMDLQLDIIKR